MALSNHFSLPTSIDLKRFFHPHTITELTGATKLRLMLLLHLPRSSEHLLLLIVIVEVPEKLQDSISNREGGLVDVLLADVLLVKDRTFELKLARVRELLAVFTIELVRDNPNKNFVLHQNAVFVLLECDVELKRAVVS